MTVISRRSVLLMGASLAVSACGVPRGAAHRDEIIAGADVSIDGAPPEFSLVLVNRATLGTIRTWPVTGHQPPSDWPGPGNGLIVPRIEPGDRLDLRIWDSAPASLITTEGERAMDMPGLTVSPTGHIFLPYVDEVKVSGVTPDVARRRIQEQLDRIIPSAQVQLSFSSGLRNSVDIVSGVATPGSYPFEERNTSILGMISAAGGVLPSVANPYVTLVRGNRVYGSALSEIYARPERDIPLQGRDRIIIEPDKRHFIALGAAERESVINFDRTQITALKAVSMMGGLADSRADPRGILILRRYPANQTGGMDMPPSQRVVFSFDLTSADGLFSADEFQVHSGDVVLATQATATTAGRVVSLLGATLGVGARVASVFD